MRAHAHDPQQRHPPWKREGEHVSRDETGADAFRRSQASAGRLGTGQLCAGLLEYRAALRKQFRIVALPHPEIVTAVEYGQSPIADVRVESTEL